MLLWAYPVAQVVKNLPTMQEIWVRFLGREDPLEKGMATHSSILTWRIPRIVEAGGLQSMGSQRVGHDWVINMLLYWTVGFSADFYCQIRSNFSQFPSSLVVLRRVAGRGIWKFLQRLRAADGHSFASTAGREHDFCFLSTF